MNDPTYIIEEIKANKVWYAAWAMSEYFNHNAPIGWSIYIPCAERVLEILSMEV